MRQRGVAAPLVFSLLFVGCAGTGLRGEAFAPPLPDAVRKDARQRREARARALAQQPKPAFRPSPAPPPTADVAPAVSAAPSSAASPADAPVVSSALVEAAPTTPAVVAAAPTAEAFCLQLCERTVACAFAELDDAFGGADPGAAREVGAQREFGVRHCSKQCLERVGVGRGALERCAALQACEPLVECVGAVTVGDP